MCVCTCMCMCVCVKGESLQVIVLLPVLLSNASFEAAYGVVSWRCMGVWRGVGVGCVCLSVCIWGYGGMGVWRAVAWVLGIMCSPSS